MKAPLLTVAATIALAAAMAASLAACGEDEERMAPAPTTADVTPAATPTQGATTTATPSPAATTATPAAGMARYVHPVHRYSIEYPAGWIVDTQPPVPSGISLVGDAVVIHSFPYCTNCAGEGPVPPGQVKIDISWISNAEGQPLEDFIRQRNIGVDVLSESPTSVSGHTAIRQRVVDGFGTEVVQVFLESAGAFYEISVAYGEGADIATIEAIPDSFRLPT